MATASKIIIRLTKFSSKISTIVDATQAFNNNNDFYQDLSGWDAAVVEIVDPTAAISFYTTNDDGSIEGQLLPAPEVPINWIPVLGVNLYNKADVLSVNSTCLIQFGIIGKYLQLSGVTPTTTTTLAPVNFDLTLNCIGNQNQFIANNPVGGSGVYQISSGLYVSEQAALNSNNFITASIMQFNNFNDDTYWVAVRDANNYSNILAKSIVANCQATVTTTTTTTTTTAAPTTTTTTAAPTPLDFGFTYNCGDIGSLNFNYDISHDPPYDTTGVSPFYTSVQLFNSQAEAEANTVWPYGPYASSFNIGTSASKSTYNGLTVWAAVKDANGVLAKSITINCP